MLLCEEGDVQDRFTGLFRDEQFPECRERHVIYSGPNLLPSSSSGGIWTTGTLEQQMLEDDTIVHAKVLGSDFKIVETDSVPFEVVSFFSYWPPPDPKYMTVTEVELEIIEYLNGGGAERVTAVIETQVGFDDWAARYCAKSAHEHQVDDSLNIDEGIAYLKSTDEADTFHFGLVLNNFSEKYRSNQAAATAAVWLPFVGNGEFYSRNEDDWLTIEDARRRVARVVEDLNRYRDDERWQSCVYSKYWSHGRKRGMSAPHVGTPFRELPKQIIHFRGEDAPIKAGTTVAQISRWPHEDYRRDLTVWLEGEHAERFAVSYASKAPYSLGRWKADHINVYGVGWANWTVREEPDPAWEGVFFTGHEITAAEDLPQGTYRFTVEERTPDSVDCGQDLEPTEYVVVVTEWSGPTDLPPPPKLSGKEWSDDNIVVGVEPVPGATKYLLSGKYRSKPYVLFEPMGEITDTSTLTIRRSELECGRIYWIGAQSFGDGETYIEFWGEPATYQEWLSFSTLSCIPERTRK